MKTNQSRLPLRKILGRLREGKSLNRAWMEHALSQLHGKGWILDFGGGSSHCASHMQLMPESRVITLDIRPDSRPSVVGDGENGLPFKGESFDAVLLMNVLEHLQDYRKALSEATRVLKPGGHLYIYVPFLFPRHTAAYGDFIVEDYYRYGPETLKLLIREAGLSGPLDVTACSEGPFTAAANIAALEIPLLFLRIATFVGCILADRLWFALRTALKRNMTPSARREWPLAYWVTAVK
jgi:SAM-dependent methyltransferase